MPERPINIYASLEQTVPVSFEEHDFGQAPIENPFFQPLIPVEEIDTSQIVFPTTSEMENFGQTEAQTIAERAHAFVDFTAGIAAGERRIIERAGQAIIDLSARYNEIQTYQDAVNSLSARREEIREQLQLGSATTIRSSRRNGLLAEDQVLEEQMALFVNRLSRFHTIDHTEAEELDVTRILTLSKLTVMRRLYNELFDVDVAINNSLHHANSYKKYDERLNRTYALLYPPEHEIDQENIPLEQVDSPQSLHDATESLVSQTVWPANANEENETPQPPEEDNWQARLWQTDPSNLLPSLRATVLPEQPTGSEPTTRTERARPASLNLTGWENVLGERPDRLLREENSDYDDTLFGYNELARAFVEARPNLRRKSAEQVLRNISNTVTPHDLLHYGLYGTFDNTIEVTPIPGADRRIARILAVIARQREIDNKVPNIPSINHGKYLPYALLIASEQFDFDSILINIEQEQTVPRPKLYDIIDPILSRLHGELARRPELFGPLLTSAVNRTEVSIMEQLLIASRENPVSESTLAALQSEHITLNDARRRTRTQIEKWQKSRRAIIHHYETGRGERFLWAELNDTEKLRTVAIHEQPVQSESQPREPRRNAYRLKDGTPVTGNTVVEIARQIEQATYQTPIRAQIIRQQRYGNLQENQGMAHVYRRIDELRNQGVQIQSFRIGENDIGYYLDNIQRADVMNVLVVSEKMHGIARTIEEALSTAINKREILRIAEEQLDIYFPEDADPMRNIVQRAINARREAMREHSTANNLRNHEFISGYIDTLQQIAVGEDGRQYLTDDELVSLQGSLNHLLGYFMSNRIGGSDMSSRIQTLNSILASVIYLRKEYPQAEFSSVDEEETRDNGITFQMYDRHLSPPVSTYIVLATTEGVITENPIQIQRVAKKSNPTSYIGSRTSLGKLRKALRYMGSQPDKDSLFFIHAPGRLPER